MNALLSSPAFSWFFAYLFNALWQIPLLFAAAWVVARMLRRAHPRVGHRVWVGALLLEVVLPACSLSIGALLSALLSSIASWLDSWLPWGPGSGIGGDGHIRILIGPSAVAGGALRLPLALEAGIVLACLCLTLYSAVRLVWGLAQTRALARRATRLRLTGELAQRWSEHCRRFRIAAPLPRIATSPEAMGPVTVGLGRGLLLLPPACLEGIAPQDLDAVLAHELAHIRRHDFAKNLLYAFISLPVAWHPLLWRSGARVAESRELICDALAAEAVAGPRRYAQALLRLAAWLAAQPAFLSRAAALHGLGILRFSQNRNALERRIMTLTYQPAPMSASRRIALAAACCVVALATCTTALALRMEVSAPAQAASENPTPKKISVPAGTIAGLKISGANPAYPREAKAKKLQGAVIIDATIGKDGAIRKLDVVKSPDKLLSDSALDAVRTWRYRPYLLNGEPVEVETTINVIYTLGG